MNTNSEHMGRGAAVQKGGPQPQSFRVRIGALSLHYLAWGQPSRPPVVLVHGAGAHAHWWNAVVADLLPEFRIVVPDLRGHGESDWAEPPSYRIEDFAGDLLGLLDAAAIESCVLAGHSMGGRVCAWIAAHHPERVTALALLDTRLGGLEVERIEKWRGRRSRGGERRGHPTRAAAEASFRLAPEESDVDPAVRSNLAHHAVVERRPGDWALRFDREVLALHGSRIADLIPLLSRVRCPALVIRGRDSSVIGDRQFEVIATALGSAEARTVPGGHHFLLSQPRVVGAALRDLARRRSRT